MVRFLKESSLSDEIERQVRAISDDSIIDNLTDNVETFEERTEDIMNRSSLSSLEAERFSNSVNSMFQKIENYRNMLLSNLQSERKRILRLEEDTNKKLDELENLHNRVFKAETKVVHKFSNR